MAARNRSAAEIADDTNKSGRVPISVVDDGPFSREARKWLDEKEYDDLIYYVAQFRELGDVVPETGGLRKLRWSFGGTGKRGGSRVIYYYLDDQAPLYLIAFYRKSANLT